MKVLCINNSNPVDAHLVLPEDGLTIGAIYTVEREIMARGKVFYALCEKPKLPGHHRVTYGAWRFVPLSDPDEGRVRGRMRDLADKVV